MFGFAALFSASTECKTHPLGGVPAWSRQLSEGRFKFEARQPGIDIRKPPQMQGLANSDTIVIKQPQASYQYDRKLPLVPALG
jgi:hypothetical protein